VVEVAQQQAITNTNRANDDAQAEDCDINSVCISAATLTD